MSTPLGSSQFFLNAFQEEGQSLRFEDGDSAYLSRTPTTAGNRKTWTWSGWVKLGNIGTTQWLFAAATSTADYSIIRINATNTVEYARVVSSALDAQKISSNILRDPSAWYHIVVAEDCTSSVAQIYVNGSEVSYGTNDNPTNVDGAINNTGSHIISGPLSGIGSGYVDGYLANVTFIDGQALDPTSFGEYQDTLWKPKPDADIQSLTFGTNGFYLNFEDSADIGADTSGNGNDWTPNNLASTDVVLDGPYNGGNFATLNPIQSLYSNSVTTFSEGNLKAALGNASNWRAAVATQQHSSGKWYYEVYANQGLNGFIGFGHDNFDINGAAAYAGSTAGSWGWLVSGGLYNNTASIDTLSTYTTGDIISIALDFDNAKAYWAKNGTWENSADPAAGTGGTSIDADKLYKMGFSNVSGYSSTANFGQDSSFAGVATPQGNTDSNGQGDFYYAPPSGFLALNTSNLPAATITAPDEYFNTVLYSGDGTSSNAITGVNFQPDFIWIKGRNFARNHVVFDSVRNNGGSDDYLHLITNSTGTEQQQADGDGLLSIDSDGFTVGYNNNATFNNSGDNYVSWNWLAGGTSVLNQQGTIDSQVSANTDAGFSVVSYTGTGSQPETVGHGLGVTPNFIIVKDRDDVTNWHVFHSAVMPYTTDGKFMRLNTTDSLLTDGSANVWYAGDFTSTVFGVGTANGVSGRDYIAYCFAEVESYSKIDSYTGNGSTDGTFVHCGFRPAWILVKRSSNTDHWFIWDSTRDSYNLSNTALVPSLNSAESSITGDEIDILSSGFKLRTTNAIGNASGDTYIFLAFAEAPFKSANAR